MNKLKIQFESRQEHQIKAIQSTVKLFDGYSKQTSNFQMGEDTIPNLDRYETLDESWLFDNLVSVQQENRLVQDMQLNCEDGFEMVGIDSWRYPYYTLDMETGTGKTRSSPIGCRAQCRRCRQAVNCDCWINKHSLGQNVGGFRRRSLKISRRFPDNTKTVPSGHKPSRWH